MVKNFSGGNKSKGFARKNFIKKESGLRVSQEEDEVYAQVTKVLGGSACHVITLDDVKMLCHIRGKFKGRGKRDNFIGNGTWLLVGKREWEKEPLDKKLLNCDIIEVYNEADKLRLKNNLININWSLFINNDTNNFGSKELSRDEGFTFADEKTQEYQDLIESQISAASAGREIVITTNEEEINIDDI
jgi:initiation factor 1A